jgi:hypothetical protein
MEQCLYQYDTQPPPYELPIYIERLNLFELFSRRLPIELCNIIEKNRIDMVIAHILKLKYRLPFKFCYVIRSEPYCKLLRSKKVIVNQFITNSKIPPKISHTILFLQNDELNDCVQYLKWLIDNQKHGDLD